jgi:hypothetical protein
MSPSNGVLVCSLPVHTRIDKRQIGFLLESLPSIDSVDVPSHREHDIRAPVHFMANITVYVETTTVSVRSSNNRLVIRVPAIYVKSSMVLLQ